MAAVSPSQDILVQCVVVNKLAAAVRSYTNELISAREGRPLSTVAWLARCLLELLIWTEFCVKSPQNATNFAIDAVRDCDDLTKRFATMDLEGHPETISSLKDFGDIRTELEADLLPGELDKRYKDVRTAAQDIGKLSFFEVGFKVLSKYAHPTAMIIMIEPIQSERSILIRDTIIGQGLEMAKETATIVKAFLKPYIDSPNPAND